MIQMLLLIFILLFKIFIRNRLNLMPNEDIICLIDS